MSLVLIIVSEALGRVANQKPLDIIEWVFGRFN